MKKLFIITLSFIPLFLLSCDDKDDSPEISLKKKVQGQVYYLTDVEDDNIYSQIQFSIDGSLVQIDNYWNWNLKDEYLCEYGKNYIRLLEDRGAFKENLIFGIIERQKEELYLEDRRNTRKAWLGYNKSSKNYAEMREMVRGKQFVNDNSLYIFNDNGYELAEYYIQDGIQQNFPNNTYSCGYGHNGIGLTKSENVNSINTKGNFKMYWFNEKLYAHRILTVNELIEVE